jgi:SAM-dependent methyltransferase
LPLDRVHVNLSGKVASFDAGATSSSEQQGVTFPDYVLAGHPLRGRATRYAVAVRTHVIEQFMASCRPVAEDRVIDIGVTPDRSLPDSNLFEKLYPFPGQITATSIEDASFLEDEYPGLRFVRTTGTSLPFEDDSFDLAFSNAVIEHVGTRADQRHFVSELLRVSRRFFITTPNRWFPLELHTFLPFLHWFPQRVHQRCLRAIGQRDWAKTENLNLLSRTELKGLFPPSTTVTLRAHRVGGMASNLMALGVANR